jgi:DNA-binding GntR family transcriptional regulator
VVAGPEQRTLPPCSQLPTEPKLAAAYGASRSTVRLAIALLIQQGLVETQQGIGTYVATPAVPLTVVLSRKDDGRYAGWEGTALFRGLPVLQC